MPRDLTFTSSNFLARSTFVTFGIIFTKKRLLFKQTSMAAHCQAKATQCVWCAKETEFHMPFTLPF
jgi:hypothetical protein